MTPQQAKEILLLYRPGAQGADEPEMTEALALAAQDSELGAWFAKHRAFQEAVRARLRSAPVPAGLRDQLLASRKVIRPAFWQRQSVWLAAAACLVLVLGLAVSLLQQPAPDRFADFRVRMVRTVLREYRMDVVTNDMTQVRRFLAEQGAPADYDLPAGLARLSLTGAGRLQWRGHAVSMVCFERADHEMIYLFVLPENAARTTPDHTLEVEHVNKLATVSWTRGNKTYLLAGPPGGDFPKSYL